MSYGEGVDRNETTEPKGDAMDKRTIWKYELQFDGRTQELEIPNVGRIVHVGTISNVLCLWVIVNPESLKIKRRFKVYGTGHIMPIKGQYTGTAVMPPFVWHVFEVE